MLCGRLSRGAASWNRPVSIALIAIAVALELEEDELAPPANAAQLLPDERRQLGRGAAHGQGRGRLGAHDRPTGKRSMEGVRDDRQVGQLGHGRAIVAVRRPVLDSAGLSGRNCRVPTLIPMRLRRSGPRPTIRRTT